MSLFGGGREKLADQFRKWNSDHDSPVLYARIAPMAAEDQEILSLYDRVEVRKQAPVALFAAVHYLILKGEDHPLARIYEAPEARGALDDVEAQFKSFCHEFFEDIEAIMQDRNIQTNEVNRCSGFLPAFMHVSRVSKKPLGLVEMGAAAGLNLLFDRYRYDYAGGPVIGQPGAAVRCHCKIRGSAPPLDTVMPQVDFRVGLDIEPIDINDDDEVLWLRACVWAGDVARDQRLTPAVELARREWMEVRKGNVLKTLEDAVDDVPQHLELVLFNSWMMSWMSQAERDSLTELVTSIAQQRPLWWVTYEWPTKVRAFANEAEKPETSLLALQHLSAAGNESRVLAEVSHHGTWIEWRNS